MDIGSNVKVTSGNPSEPSIYEGYYGQIVAMGTEYATVTHKPDFAGFQIPLSDLVDYE